MNSEVSDVYFSFFVLDTMKSVRCVLGRRGKKVGEATRQATDLAGNTWQHCEFSSFIFFIFFQVCVHLFQLCSYKFHEQEAFACHCTIISFPFSVKSH